MRKITKGLPIFIAFLTVMITSSICATALAEIEIAQSTNVQPIDLENNIDENGVSKDLINEIEEIKTLHNEEKNSGSKVPGNGEKIKAKREQFYKRLPFTPKTRDAQSRIGALQKKLSTVKSEPEAMAILQQMRDAQKEMLADPNYGKIKDQLRKHLITKGYSKKHGSLPQTDSTLAYSETLSTSFYPSLSKPLIASLGQVFVAASNLFTSKTPLNVKFPEHKLQTSSNISSGQIKRGDLLLLDATDGAWTHWIYAMRYGHAGVYNGNNQVYGNYSVRE